jgi:hypothetical protein
MKIPTRISLSLLAVIVFLLASSACTTDNTTDTISSTTPGLWYTGDGLVKSEYKTIAFTTLNFENLKHDMAQGRGEYLASLGTLLGVPRDRQVEFFSLAQEKYPILVYPDRTTPHEMLQALHRELVASPTLRYPVHQN